MFTTETFKVGKLVPVKLNDGRTVKGVICKVHTNGSIRFNVERTPVSKGIPPKRGNAFVANLYVGMDCVTNFAVLFSNGAFMEFRVKYGVKPKEGVDLWTAYLAYYREKITFEEFMSMIEITQSVHTTTTAWRHGAFNYEINEVRRSGFPWKKFFRHNVLDSIAYWDRYYDNLQDSCDRMGSAAFTYGT